MSLPDFICIGAQKAGTTWLYSMLPQNPSIWMPPLKEVHFFDRMHMDDAKKGYRRINIENTARKKMKRSWKAYKADRTRSTHPLSKLWVLLFSVRFLGWRPFGRFLRNQMRQSAHGIKAIGNVDFLLGLNSEHLLTEDWYRGVFSHQDRIGRISGEITPSYLALDDGKVAYVKSLLPNAKILLIVREPAARNMSQIKMAAARSRVGEPSKADWETFLEKLESKGRGNYAENIPIWQKHFGPEQFLILPFSLIKTDPAGMIAKIEAFIGAQPFDGYKALNEQVHKTKDVAVPDWVAERAVKLAKPQQDYLIDAFGMEFYEKTR